MTFKMSFDQAPAMDIAQSPIGDDNMSRDWLLAAAFPLLSFITTLNAILVATKTIDKAKVQTALARAMRAFWQKLPEQNCSEILKGRLDAIWRAFLATYAGQNNWAHCLEAPSVEQHAPQISPSGANAGNNREQNFLTLVTAAFKDFPEDFGLLKFLYILLTLNGYQNSKEQKMLYAHLTNAEIKTAPHDGILVETLVDKLQAFPSSDAVVAKSACKKFFSPLMIFIIGVMFVAGGGLYLLLSKNLNGVLQPVYTLVNDSSIRTN